MVPEKGTAARSGHLALKECGESLAAAHVDLHQRGTRAGRSPGVGKQVTFSRGLRRRYKLAEEDSDEEIADRDMGGADVIALPVETWRAIHDHAEQLLTHLGRGEGLDHCARLGPTSAEAVRALPLRVRQPGPLSRAAHYVADRVGGQLRPQVGAYSTTRRLGGGSRCASVATSATLLRAEL